MVEQSLVKKSLMNDCGICLKRVTRRQRVTSPPCGHDMFHQDCLAEWMKVSATCPLCKSSLQAFATACAAVDERRRTRAQRRICMAAGIGNLSQFDEDLLMATELSMLDS